MSLLTMFACEGCGASAEARISILGIPEPPKAWLVVRGPATDDEARVVSHRNDRAPKRHACSPACLVDVAMRLAELPGARQPAGQVAP